MSQDERTPESTQALRSRRTVLAGAAAAAGALAAQAVVRPESASAASVTLGVVNTAAAATTIRTTQASSSAKAIVGLVTHAGAGQSTAGVQGQSNAVHGNGVFGVALAGNSKGIWGRSLTGTGVYGEATGTTGTNLRYGVYGTSKSLYGIGVRGDGTNTGVWGIGGPFGVYGVGTGFGVYGVGTGGGNYAVFGEGYNGVLGRGTNIGVIGEGAVWAGYFQGPTHVQGTLTASNKQFLIDHPKDPANRTLAHACVEAPEMLNIYRGSVILSGRGTATVRLPRYHDALNRDHHVQLTAVGAPAPSLHLAQEVRNGRFAIAGGTPGQKVYWIVTGARQDAWAQKHPLRVERTKKRTERGKYLNPEVFGKPVSASIHGVVLPAGMTRRPRRRAAA